MTADIRTAAQREIESRSEIEIEGEEMFVDGAVWAQSRVTPTREQIQERMQAHHFEECVFDGGVRTNWWFAKCSCGWEGPESAYPSDAHDAYYVHASEQVTALMAGLAEGEAG